jgi:DNA mismatch repair protein MutS
VRAAKRHLAKLEEEAAGRSPQGDLFSAAAKPPQKSENPLRETVLGLDPDTLSPKEALELLYRLRNIAEGMD